MGKVYVTGDCHGEIDIHKLNNKNFPQQKELTREDFLIIVGDFGFPWNDDSEDRFWLKWMNNKNFTTLFIEGNHDNIDLIRTYPEEEWHGGKVRKIRENVLYLERNQVFTIYGKTFYTLGGAESTDKEVRTESVNWWADEVPSEAELDKSLHVLADNNWKVDFILTHTCSRTVLNALGEEVVRSRIKGELLNDHFESIREKLNYEHWYFGHFHKDIRVTDKDTLLFNKVIRVI